MSYSKISQVAHYLPEQVVTNDDLSQIMETSDDWIKSRTGIEERRISKTEKTSDLATEVAKKLLLQSGYDAQDIDFIIVATISPDSMMPSTAAIVQANIGAKNAFVFDLTAACSGFVFALSTADKFIQSSQYSRGIVIGAETLSKTLDWSDRTTAVLFGDGAGGVLLETSEEPYILAESLNSDGSKGGLSSGITALKSPFSVESVDQPYLQMDGRSIFDFAIRDVSKSISNIIETAPIEANQIDYLLLHQANNRILDKMAKKIGIPREKFPANMMSYGNTSAASIPILLSECVADGRISFDGSQTILLSGFGGGLTWGSLIVKI
ncbi:3-oxoacyl-[acyl-carrier-protein] synthase 3 [Streptococcus urinalis FB127-CNA-2]|uniref:Beta-ketoacyl-[acyl-carrier-protein] synthase III n=1 Tax=Streptococcus urinalis 2285-97 TaxID=764291 RepID=G5KCV0_9STRE|nr:beta-ketoacyl-ACP synthase III [Streptococcus urinalis]EHJ55700.1 3-oxoacyl-(acyl carrier protein) synthase III [Streptococcus urinalis 2285-97]EKS17129.1 3-oxoacyl-[acyl-carrier-protein] synthase 3 [Streptococcus urinalis FB127-CNA-2]VEF32621.1 3-oxoacyl-ACP synthase III [Streptococcus urinalis]